VGGRDGYSTYRESSKANHPSSAIGPADTRICADPQHPIRGVPRHLDDLVLRQPRHGRTGDRSGEPVPGFDKLILRPLVLEGQGQSVRSHARSMPPRADCPWAPWLDRRSCEESSEVQ
jgi:hypothetical protein